jgi:hypothetical protein
MTGMAISMKGNKRARHKANVPDLRVKRAPDPVRVFMQKRWRIDCLEVKYQLGEFLPHNFIEAEKLGMTLPEPRVDKMVVTRA